MLPDVSRDDRVALGQVRHLLDDVLRADAFAALVVFIKGLLFLPLEDLLMPLGPRRTPFADTLASLHRVEHVGQYALDVADDRDTDLDIFRDRGRIDIDVDDGLGLRREILDASGDAIVEARADRDQAIGVADRGVGAIRAVHAQHSEA